MFIVCSGRHRSWWTGRHLAECVCFDAVLSQGVSNLVYKYGQKKKNSLEESADEAGIKLDAFLNNPTEYQKAVKRGLQELNDERKTAAAEAGVLVLDLWRRSFLTCVWSAVRDQPWWNQQLTMKDVEKVRKLQESEVGCSRLRARCSR